MKETEAKPFWIVLAAHPCVDDDAGDPDRYDTYGDADSEAQRLALAHPGETFVVMAVQTAVRSEQRVVAVPLSRAVAA